MPATAQGLTPAPGPSQGGPGAASSRFRGDIEGLRAVAVALVLLYHAGLPVLTGGFVGVDLFFVVSGFVITTQLLREVETSGQLSLAGFYGRRAKRLLPAAGAVLLVTAAVSWAWAPRDDLPVIAGDITGAAAYVVNWVFAGRVVDYAAEDPSPVLHFWSLAVGGQFYVLWPLVILLLIWLLRRRAAASAAGAGRPVPGRGRLALGLLALIVVPSLAWSAHATAQQPAEAFFLTTTRLWELGIGALVALGPSWWLRLPRGLAALLGWAGLAMIAVSALTVSMQTPWPGTAALLPTLGAALVIVGGFVVRRAGAARFLGMAPLVWVGGLSYSLYLWHWPLLRFAEWRFGELGILSGLAVVAASFLPAYLSYRFLERPIRFARSLQRSPRLALSVGANVTMISLVCGLVLAQATTDDGEAPGRATGATWDLTTSTPTPTPSPSDGKHTSPSGTGGTSLPSGGDRDTPVAGADNEGKTASGPALPGPERPGDSPFFDRLTPDPLLAESDLPEVYGRGCHTNQTEDTVRVCEDGDKDSDIVVAVAGDSKIAQWHPALAIIAEQEGWRLRTYTKSGCQWTAAMTEPEVGVPNVLCHTWGKEVMRQLTSEPRPSVLITSGVRSRAQDGTGQLTEEGLVTGYVEYWDRLEAQGTKVIVLSDTPPGPPSKERVYECVDEHRDDPSACSWPLKAGHGDAALRAAVDQVPGAVFIDMNPWVCPGGTCVGVYRNVVTYRQGSHITATFAATLAEPLAAYLVPVVEGATSGPSGP